MYNIRTCLIISPEPWSQVFVSKHHYAMELARRGVRVFFLNPPEASKFRHLQVTNLSEVPGVTIIDYPGQLRGVRFLPTFIRVWINKLFLKQLEKVCGYKMDMIWNFENSRFYDMQFAGKRLKIYHQVDLNQEFHVKQAASYSDICFCTSEVIKRVIEPWNKKVFKVQHGVQREAFCDESGFNRNERVTACYIGNLDIKYLDVGLLQSLVQEFPDVHFKLIGNYNINGNTFKHLSIQPNVTFTGPVKSELIKEYLKQSDILLVCYKAEEYRDQLSNPHKLMEYLASGKTVVATYTDEYKDKTELLEMSESNDEYVEKFRRVVTNLDFYNSVENQQKRIAFARNYLYNRQVDMVFTLIKQNVAERAFS